MMSRAAAAVALLAACAAGCRPVPASRPPAVAKADPSRQAEAAGFWARIWARTMAAAESAGPKLPPRPGPAPVVRERVRGLAPAATEADADEEAVKAAVVAVEQGLAGLDPPVYYRPTPNEVRNEFVRRDGRAVVLEAVDPDLRTLPLVFVVLDVEVSADQVRRLRSVDRVGDGLRLLGVLTAVFGAGYGFLRLDERTKGYLTRWLAAGAVALALGAAAAMYLV
ncbi:MAG: hypothetical protein C0501_20660 [Isosphaera sp.]|nr:hypothetical protein [Isosphaera sp.]